MSPTCQTPPYGGRGEACHCLAHGGYRRRRLLFLRGGEDLQFFSRQVALGRISDLAFIPIRNSSLSTRAETGARRFRGAAHLTLCRTPLKHQSAPKYPGEQGVGNREQVNSHRPTHTLQAHTLPTPTPTPAAHRAGCLRTGQHAPRDSRREGSVVNTHPPSRARRRAATGEGGYVTTQGEKHQMRNANAPEGCKFLSREKNANFTGSKGGGKQRARFFKTPQIQKNYTLIVSEDPQKRPLSTH